MKIKIKELSYEQALKQKKQKRKKPLSVSLFFRLLLYIVSIPDLLATHFKLKKTGMEKLSKKENCLFLMNHSSFIDLEIAVHTLFPRRVNIVATSDSFVGKALLLRLIGCIPTNKFTSDVSLVRDIMYASKELKSSILLFPEASYSFDGTATPLPDSIGNFIKKLSLPVVMIKTEGAFTRDPLYNGLQRRKVNVSAEHKFLLSSEDISRLSTEEIQKIVEKEFDFDNFSWQKDNNILVKEDFRADFLNRVLYKCPHCNTEGNTEGKGVFLSCKSCGKSYFMQENGQLQPTDGEGAFSHVPSWYAWQRECVRRECESGEYSVTLAVDICVSFDCHKIYRVGEGVLTHNCNGFSLTGCNGALSYSQGVRASYSLYSDFNWYEIGDMVCIGNSRVLYYCFPKTKGDVVAKMRLAAEELYKIATGK